jgi:hypothetical protein
MGESLRWFGFQLTESFVQNRLLSAGRLGLRERPAQVAQTATTAGALRNCS